MQLFAIGINHHTAPLTLRERIVFPAEALIQALDYLRKEISCQANSTTCETTILSTCNRTEVYLATPNIEASNIVINWLSRKQQLSITEFTSHCYSLSHTQAVRHLFRVASGLDSMVLGETQILGQIKAAVRAANQSGTIKVYLNQLFQRAFAVAKVVRGQTEIGVHSVSMAAAAVRLAQRIFSSLQEQRILFIGAGEMISLCATHFCAHRPAYVAVANRNIKNADLLISKLSKQGINVHSLPLTALPETLATFDIVISCTASTLPIIHLDMVKQAIRLRKHRPILMIDLAVPRDIEVTVSRLEDIFLYTIDDLGTIVSEGNALRQAAVQQAEVIIENHLQAFLHWLNKRSVVPLICDLRQQSQILYEYELKRARRLLAQGVSPEKAMEKLAKAITNKFLHGPIDALSHAQGDKREALLQIISSLLRQSTYSER